MTREVWKLDPVPVATGATAPTGWTTEETGWEGALPWSSRLTHCPRTARGWAGGVREALPCSGCQYKKLCNQNALGTEGRLESTLKEFVFSVAGETRMAPGHLLRLGCKRG